MSDESDWALYEEQQDKTEAWVDELLTHAEKAQLGTLVNLRVITKHLYIVCEPREGLEPKYRCPANHNSRPPKDKINKLMGLVPWW